MYKVAPLNNQSLFTSSVNSICSFRHNNYVLASSLRVGSRRPLSLTSSIFHNLAKPRRATQRLSLISRHLDQRPQLAINTPYSTERISQESDDLPYVPIERPPPDFSKIEEEQKKKLASMSTQASHNTLLIPGPIEFDDAVLQSMSHYRYAPHARNDEICVC